MVKNTIHKKPKRTRKKSKRTRKKPKIKRRGTDDFVIVDSKNDVKDSIYVMWVRHCNSYANDTKLQMDNIVDFFKKKVTMQPLCTKGTDPKEQHLNYLTQPYYYYEKLIPILQKYDFEELKLYSSILPRAMETSKLIGMGFNNYIKNENEEFKQFKTKTVQPMNWCSEIDNIPEGMIKKTIGMEGSQNNTSLEAHHIYLKDINRFLIGPPNIQNKEAMKQEINRSDKSDFYQKWKERYIDRNGEYPVMGPKKTLHLIVSHGTFISEQVIGRANKGKNKIHNLDSFLFEYQINKNGNITEKLIGDKVIQHISPKEQTERELNKFMSTISDVNEEEMTRIFLENTHVPNLDIKKPKSTFSKFTSSIFKT